MRTLLWAFLPLLFLSASCTHKGDNAFVYSSKVIVKEHPQTSCHLRSDKVISGDCLLGCVGLKYANNQHILLCLLNSSSEYRLLDIENENYIDFFSRGNGPGELIDPNVSNIYQKNDSLYLDLIDTNVKRMITI